MEEIGSTSYQYVSEEKVPELLICGICTCPYVKPLRTPCNHYFCSSCITHFYQYSPNNKLLLNNNNNNNNNNDNNNENKKEETNVKNCPTCRKEISFSSIVEETHPLILQQLNSLQIYCTKKENGCEWKGPRSNLQDHFQLSCSAYTCKNKSKGCKWKGLVKNREVHLVKECEFVKVFCKHRKTLKCEFSTERKFISSHELNCQKYLDHKKRMEKKMEDEKDKGRKKMEEIQKKLNERKEEVLSNRAIRLNVSGTLFTSSLKTLCADQSSLLYSIYFHQLHNTNKYSSITKNISINTSDIVNNNINNYGSKGVIQEEEEIFLDCDAKSFSHILFWLRSGELPMDLKEKEIQCIRITSSYLNLTSLLSYLPSYFPSLPSSQSQKFMEISSKLSKNQNTSSSLSFSPSLVIPDQFYNLLSDMDDKENTNENIYSNNYQNQANKKRKFEKFEEIHQEDAQNENQHIKLTSDQLVSISKSVKKNSKSKVDMKRRDFSKEKAVAIQLTNALFNESLFKDCSLANCNFTSSDFNKSNFENAILHSSNFMNCNLSDCNFQNANLSNTNLSHANFSNSNLQGVNLKNANLTYTDLSNSDLSNANLEGTILDNTQISKKLSRSILPNVAIGKLRNEWNNGDLSFTNLSGFDFSGVNLSGCNLSNCDLTRTNFSNANLSNCDFSNSNLSGANLSYSILFNAKLKTAKLGSTNLSHIDFSHFDLSSMNLSFCDFSSSNLTSADFSESNLSAVKFNAANITDTNFSNYAGALARTKALGVPRNVSNHCRSCISPYTKNLKIPSTGVIIDCSSSNCMGIHSFTSYCEDCWKRNN